MEDIQTALMLLGVGMLTVFSILTLVVLSGKGLIHFVNRFVFKETLPDLILNQKSELTPKQIAAISAAIQQASQGRANIEKISKLKK